MFLINGVLCGANSRKSSAYLGIESLYIFTKSFAEATVNQLNFFFIEGGVAFSNKREGVIEKIKDVYKFDNSFFPNEWGLNLSRLSNGIDSSSSRVGTIAVIGDAYEFDDSTSESEFKSYIGV